MTLRKHFFTARVVKLCKRLPGEVVDAPNLSVFKRHLDNALAKRLYLGQPWTGQETGQRIVVGLF